MDAAKKAQLCHRQRERKPLLKQGGVVATFERVLEMMPPLGFDVRVHSRPPKGPWLITIENFLGEHEIRALMEKGGHHFERSLAGDGVSPVRTSKTSWCNVPFCESDPVIRSVKARVANVTGVPLANSEHVQVLQYDPGDFYRQHHDQNAATHSPWGPRLFTFCAWAARSNPTQGLHAVTPGGCCFLAAASRLLTIRAFASNHRVCRLAPAPAAPAAAAAAAATPSVTYLNDVPEGGGGGTRFTHLNITVEAKRGRAVFWPSVFDHDPSAVRATSDQRTTHEALTVTKGQKFAANMWLHQFDFQNTLGAGCRNEDLAEWRPMTADEADTEPPPEPELAESDELSESSDMGAAGTAVGAEEESMHANGAARIPHAEEQGEVEPLHGAAALRTLRRLAEKNRAVDADPAS